MYELNPLWQKFYRELDPIKRRKIMEECLTQEDDGANAFRKEIFEKRHTDPRDPKRRMDLFLLQCTYLPSLYRKRKFFLINTKKEVDRSISDLQLEHVEQFTEAEQAAMYWELRNAARRYFKTCGGSKYGSSLFGISKAKDDEKERLAARDAWQMSYGISRYCHLEEKMSLFCEAVRDAFGDHYENGEELFEWAIQKHKNDEM